LVSAVKLMEISDNVYVESIQNGRSINAAQQDGRIILLRCGAIAIPPAAAAGMLPSSLAAAPSVNSLPTMALWRLPSGSIS